MKKNLNSLIKEGKLPKINELEDECNLEKLMEDNFELNEDIKT